MDIKDEQDKQEKRKREEYNKNPMINFADSINRSQFGDLKGLTQVGCRKKLRGKIIGVFLIMLILAAVVSFCYRIGFCPFLGKIIAEDKLAAYAKVQMQSTAPIQVKYNWYNGRYICSSDNESVLSYRLQNNTIYDESANMQVNAEVKEFYKNVVKQFPVGLIFPEHITMWSTINADNYAIKAQRLYLLEVYNVANLSDTESDKMPANIARDIIALMGEKYNITGIQLIYADQNGMYDIEISADSFQPLEYEQLLKATQKRSEKELPSSYREWLENNGFN